MRRLPGRDHQLNGDLSEVARDIRQLTSRAVRWPLASLPFGGIFASMPTTSARPARFARLLAPVRLVPATTDFPLVFTALRMLHAATSLPIARRVERVA